MNKQLLYLVMTLLPMAACADESGTCGTNVSFTYDSSTETLTISGFGTMADYTLEHQALWYSYGLKIFEVIIKDGVTSIGSFAFYGCYSLTSVTSHWGVRHRMLRVSKP